MGFLFLHTYTHSIIIFLASFYSGLRRLHSSLGPRHDLPMLTNWKVLLTYVNYKNYDLFALLYLCLLVELSCPMAIHHSLQLQTRFSPNLFIYLYFYFPERWIQLIHSKFPLGSDISIFAIMIESIIIYNNILHR